MVTYVERGAVVSKEGAVVEMGMVVEIGMAGLSK